MNPYQVIARKFRPFRFSDVIGQDAIVTTLKHAIAQKRVAHAYLFSGSRGTGKTTLARLFAKALNCPHLSQDLEPCNQCSICKEIAASNSLDVIEIDGASHRGIEDIRQINETIGYTPSSYFKIYLIDEVHMLTKEAFNALLKTLEEPPERVKFFFATTEAHKIPHTILSRCQRFNLNRISSKLIIKKLNFIASELKIQTEPKALHLISTISEGGLRDAESLMDQIISFESKVTLHAVNEVLGLLPLDLLFKFDEKGAQQDYSAAFELAHQLFASGKNISYFFDLIIRHFRNHLLFKLEENPLLYTELSEEEQTYYKKNCSLYLKEQCLFILDLLIEAQQRMKTSLSQRIGLEMTLLQIVKSHQRQSLEQLVLRLEAIELRIKQANSDSSEEELKKATDSEKIVIAKSSLADREKIEAKNASENVLHCLNEDPTPLAHDLTGLFPNKNRSIYTEKEVIERTEESNVSKLSSLSLLQRRSHYDTLMQFAAREFNGSINKNRNN